jgi:hypothetical protein
MIYRGSDSGSDYGKVSVLAPAPISAPGTGSRPYLADFKLNFLLHLAFKCYKQHCFPESWPFIILILILFLFMLDPNRNPVPEPELQFITVPVPLG